MSTLEYLYYWQMVTILVYSWEKTEIHSGIPANLFPLFSFSDDTTEKNIDYILCQMVPV